MYFCFYFCKRNTWCPVFLVIASTQKHLWSTYSVPNTVFRHRHTRSGAQSFSLKDPRGLWMWVQEGHALYLVKGCYLVIESRVILSYWAKGYLHWGTKIFSETISPSLLSSFITGLSGGLVCFPLPFLVTWTRVLPSRCCIKKLFHKHTSHFSN